MRTFIRPAALKVGIVKAIGWHTFRHYAESGMIDTRSAL